LKVLAKPLDGTFLTLITGAATKVSVQSFLKRFGQNGTPAMSLIELFLKQGPGQGHDKSWGTKAALGGVGLHKGLNDKMAIGHIG
jgi:hypothetical protein